MINKNLLENTKSNFEDILLVDDLCITFSKNKENAVIFDTINGNKKIFDIEKIKLTI